MIKKGKKNILKAGVFVIIILIADFYTIMNMTLGDTDLTNFRCDIEKVDFKSYKADVYDTINFTFNRQDAANVFAIMGDGNVIWDISGTTFSYNYSIEGIYNVTLWAQIPGLDSEWLIIEVLNDAPEFDIGIAPIEYYPATYDFEDDDLNDVPHDWEIYDNDIPLYLIQYTKITQGQNVSGNYDDLKFLDGKKWIIRTNQFWPYSDIEIDINFMALIYEFLPGKFELYFQANRSMILRENTGYGDYRKVFEGESAFGEVITLSTPFLELVTSLEDIFQSVEIDWLVLVAIDNGVEVIKDVNDHGKIAQISLLNSSTLCGIRQDFPSQLYGTIELWYKTSETMLGGRISSQSDFIDLIQKSNSWYLGSTNITSEIGVTPLEHTWYHIRIDWRDSGSPPYESLNSGFYRVYIDGNPSNQYSLNSGGSGISSLNIETNTIILIDAVGYTWDGYTLGDNKISIYPENIYEDQEITFSVIELEESKIDQKGFSYNSESPIIGNYSYLWDFANGNYSSDESPSFRFSKAGDYPVRLTLVDDQGAMTTKVRNISIKNKKPEVSIWNGINFDSTYDFKHDLSGQSPSGWTTAGNVKVVDFKDKFSKVIEIDTTAGGFGSMNIKENIGLLFDSIEFWIYFSDVNEDEFYFRAGPQFVTNPKEEIRFGLFDGVWKYYYTWEDPVFGTQYNYAEITELNSPQSEEWIHVRFQLIDYDNWRIFINDVPSQSYGSVGNFYIFNIGLFVESGSHIFLDSFGFASDPNYDIGDNNPPQLDTYYGSWDFRFYPNGPIPFDNDKKLSTLGPWTFTSYGFGEVADSCSANIVSDLDDHIKILELQDNNESDVIIASLLDLAKPTYGTIEFWLRTTDVSQGLLMTFGYEVFRSGISINSEGGWSYKNGNQEIPINDVPQLLDDTWRHIRIDFDNREDGGYLGLGANQFYFWVDRVFSRLGPFNFDDSVSNFKWNIWSTKEEGKDYSIYLDAIGVSWDTSYDIGDNLLPREAVYVETEIVFNADSFDTASDKNNLRYFWNFGDNQSAFGETILHRYGRPGKYKVQLIAIDDNGLYDIDEKYVWIDNIDPVIKIFKIGYGVSDDFTNDIVGEFPSGWFPTVFEDIYGKITKVVDHVDGFDKPVQIGMGTLFGGIWLSNETGAPISSLPGDLNETYGTIEFWLYTNDTTQSDFAFQFYENEFNDGVNLFWNSTHWIQADYSGEYNHYIISFSDSWELKNNTWTHFRIDFCSDDSYYMGLENGTYKIYADGHSSQVLPICTRIGTFGETEFITNFGVWTINPTGSEFQGAIYVDDFGFSWDPYYNVGDNLNLDRIVQFNEGETIILDCMSYDTYLDYQQLSYFWGDASTNIEDWTEMGWIHSYFFSDDTYGEDNKIYSINSFVRDSLNNWDFDSYNMKIVNVPPSFSISSTNVPINITASIYNQGIEGANFTVYIKANNEVIRTIYANYPTNYPENRIFSNKTEVLMDVSKNWTILINQTAREGGNHLFDLTLEFENGLTINETYLFDGMTDVWMFEVNNLWVDPIDNLSSVPLLFKASVSDPSNDLIDLSIDYVIEAIYEVDYPSSSLQRYYTIQNEPNDIICILSITEENGKKYATIEFREEIQKDWNELLLSGLYPVCYDFNFTVDMTNIDIYGFISNIIQDIGSLSIIDHLATTYKIESKYQDLGSISYLQTKILNYNITSKFEFENLAPSIRMHAPKNITEDQTYEYVVFVEDAYNENVSVSFTFGINNGTGLIRYKVISLGNNKYGFNYSYSNAGTYLITVIADNGISESKFIHQIEVINIDPYAKIKVYQSSAFEDQYIRFEADVFDTESDIDTLRYYWDFGDGVCVSEFKTIHRYINAGNYTVRFIVRDDNGGVYYASEEVMIIEQPPQIYGPLSFKGAEGQMINLDVDISDSFSESIMNFTWDVYEAYRIYNGTYNFMNYNEGETPGFPFIDYSTADDINYTVLDEIAGHNKVLVIEDNNNQSSGSWSLNYGDSGSINGSIEFWLRASYIAPKEENLMIQLLEYGTTLVPIILSENGSWMFKNLFTGNQSIIPNVPKIISNTWHHIRIDYECTTGGYLGLVEDHWRIIVDGISSPDLDMQLGIPPNDDAKRLDTLKLITKASGNISLFCDAIGFHNGSTVYTIGDNYAPILFSHNYVRTVNGDNPSLALNEGNYLIELSSENNLISEEVLTIDIANNAPIISTSNKKYSGSPGYIEMNAHAYDSIIDIDKLEFEWFIGGERIHIESGNLKSSAKILCDSTGTIKGHVSVRDSSDYSATVDFVIMVFIDSNGNGLSDEYEVLSGIYGIDFDGDNLPSLYETTILGTSPTLWDTDNDGLCDGWDNSTQSGEFNYTNATNPDTDGDNLLDGFEFFGWNVSIYDNGETKLYRYTSNPLEPDSDFDGIYDYYEYLNSTNPLESDTDNDGLTDFEEIHIFQTDPTDPDCDDDGLLDGKEFEIGTKFDNSDTDGDGIIDGDEYKGWDNFHTDPLCKDTDHDFLTDSSETINYNFLIDSRKSVENGVILTFEQDGIYKAAAASLFYLLAYNEMAPNDSISDVRVRIFKADTELLIVDTTYQMDNSNRYISNATSIKEIIETAKESYYGDYILRVDYLEQNHAEMMLEEYSLELSRYLDPNIDDFDNDGIIDGVENSLLVEGVNVEQYNEEVNLTVDTNSTTTDSYQIEITDIGRIENANFSFTVFSNNTLLGDGNVLVEVVKRELDCRKTDGTVFSSLKPFSAGGVVSNDYFVDLRGYFPGNYYGIYDIIIDVYDNDNSDSFFITNITIITDGYREATLSDSRAWITKPEISDTDGDGWSDGYEIYRAEMTNPLAWDTDGDGIKDSVDIDPLYNIVLQVNFIKGHIHNLETWYVERRNPPLLQMTVDFDQKGKKTSWTSTHTSCSEEIKTAIASFLGIELGRIDYYSTAAFGHSYVIDIEDNIQNYLLTFKLWDEFIGDIDQYGDNLLITKSYWHNLQTSGVNNPIEVYEAQGDNWLRASVTTRRLNHTNTIAIFDNSSQFNGHYNQYNRMNIVQINVNDFPVSNSPFEYGINYILLPNEIFINTELNYIIQNDLENSLLASGEYISVDRDNVPESSSKHIDSIFKIECSYLEAEEILNFTLNIIFNLTTGEITPGNLYVSSKLNQCAIELMNVHQDILDLVPYYCPYANSEEGTVPIERTDRVWWADPLDDFVNNLAGIIFGPLIELGLLFLAFLNFVWELFVSVVVFVILFYLIAVILLVKTLVLVSAYAFFAYTMVGILKEFALLIAFAFLICVARGLELTLTPNSLTVQGQITFSYKYEFEFWYLPFFDFYFPSIKETYIFGGGNFTRDRNFITAFTNPILTPANTIENALLSCELDPNLPDGDTTDFYQGIADSMNLFGFFMATAAATLIVGEVSNKILASITAFVQLFGLGVIFSRLIFDAVSSNLLSKQYLRGIYVGGSIVTLFNNLISVSDSKIEGKWKKFNKAYDLYKYFEFATPVLKHLFNVDILGVFTTGRLFTGVFPDTVDFQFLLKSSDVARGLLTLGLGAFVMTNIPDVKTKNRMANSFKKMASLFPLMIYLSFCIY